MNRSSRALWAAAAVISLSGCPGKKEEPHRILPAPIASFSVDTAPENELAEGPREAFGLLLPRDIAVKVSFPDAVFGTGSMQLEAIANYVRERVEAERVDTGPAKTVFQHAKVKRDPSRVVSVEVSNVGQGKVEVVVRDETPRPPDGLSTAERWRRAGLTPDGKKVDQAQAE